MPVDRAAAGLVGGLVGMGVDAATGSTLEHFPNPVSANLEPLAVSSKHRKRHPARPSDPVREEPAPVS